MHWSHLVQLGSTSNLSCTGTLVWFISPSLTFPTALHSWYSCSFVCVLSDILSEVSSSLSKTQHIMGNRFVVLRPLDNPEVPVSYHFNTLSHSYWDLCACGLLHCYDEAQQYQQLSFLLPNCSLQDDH